MSRPSKPLFHTAIVYECTHVKVLTKLGGFYSVYSWSTLFPSAAVSSYAFIPLVASRLTRAGLCSLLEFSISLLLRTCEAAFALAIRFFACFPRSRWLSSNRVENKKENSALPYHTKLVIVPRI